MGVLYFGEGGRPHDSLDYPRLQAGWKIANLWIDRFPEPAHSHVSPSAPGCHPVPYRRPAAQFFNIHIPSIHIADSNALLVVNRHIHCHLKDAFIQRYWEWYVCDDAARFIPLGGIAEWYNFVESVAQRLQATATQPANDGRCVEREDKGDIRLVVFRL